MVLDYSGINELLQTGFRLYYVDSGIRNFNSYIQGTSYRPFISFDYLTCDPNATCNQSAGTCTCNAGFTGSGTSCRGTLIVVLRLFIYVKSR